MHLDPDLDPHAHCPIRIWIRIQAKSMRIQIHNTYTGWYNNTSNWSGTTRPAVISSTESFGTIDKTIETKENEEMR